MNNTFQQLIGLMSSKSKRQLIFLCFGILFVAFVELVGIASIFPFFTVALNPSVIETNVHLNRIYELIGFKQHQDFLVALGGVVLLLIFFGNLFSAFISWVLLRFIHFQGHELSCRVFTKYLRQPYAFFLENNTSELSKNVIAEVNRVITGTLMPSFQLLSKTVVVVSILTLLTVFDPKLALMTIGLLGSIYLTIFIFIRRFMNKIGKDVSTAYARLFTILGESLSSIKELKVLGREQYFINAFSDNSKIATSHTATSQAIPQMTRYILEAIAFGGMISIVLYLINAKQNFASALPLLSLYAFAGYRLMPAMQQIFSAATELKYNANALNIIHGELTGSQRQDEDMTTVIAKPLSLKDAIRFNHVDFSYVGSDPLFNDLSLTFEANKTIGFVGTTGSGKTTMIDLILGLIHPCGGSISVDGSALSANNLNSWHRLIGYVPQQITLTDSTIASNIALGVEESEIDMDAVRKAARIANIEEFIESLPDGYDAQVGERGVRISGGQKQRIGIARALYHDPSILILDEATSALDGTTENAIIDALSELMHQKTIFIIAHRLSTLKFCDEIYMVKEGQVLSQGTYESMDKQVIAQSQTGS